jgi:hypothetical protein
MVSVSIEIIYLKVYASKKTASIELQIGGAVGNLSFQTSRRFGWALIKAVKSMTLALIGK